MDVKTFLRSYQAQKRYAETLLRQYDQASEVWIRSPKLDGLPRSGQSGGIEDQIARADAIFRRAMAERSKALETLEKIETLIDSLTDPREKMVVRLKYIAGMTWDEVAQEAAWSSATVRRVHGDALQHLRGMWNDAENSPHELRGI